MGKKKQTNNCLHVDKLSSILPIRFASAEIDEQWICHSNDIRSPLTSSHFSSIGVIYFKLQKYNAE